jgi:hypothetical protein
VSFVIAEPEMVQAAARSLAGIRSTLSEATAAAAGPTTAVAAAAEDQVSAGVAALFGAFGRDYQVLSTQAQAFHGQFVNLLNGGAAAYLSTDAAAASSIGGAYQSLFTNTAANVQSLSTTWTNVTAPALLQAIHTDANLRPLLSALTTGNPLPLLNTAGRFARGFANLFQDLIVPASVSITSLNPPNASLAIGLGLPQLLAFDALGAPVNAALAASSSSTTILNAVQTGNPLAVMSAMVDAPANVVNAFLNGEQMLPVPLPVPGLTADVPFDGLLVPAHPFTTTTSLPGNPVLQTVTVTGPPVGGFLPALLNYAPQLLASAFSS